jgi:DNA-binding NtrC family response regulator
MARILIVDDEPSMRRILATLLRDAGHDVLEADGVKTALNEARAGAFDLVLTDQKMRDGTGLELLAALTDLDASLPVILVTAFATVDLAVDAMRQGAFDFITKPFQPGVVRAAVTRACGHGALLRENLRLKEQVKRLGPATELVGDSDAILRVREHLAKVAPTDVTVLIRGETGTGKELAARAIHELSPRAENPFIAVNCASLSENLLESELFGHEKGAFTGADKARQGLFEAANGGTLFLDEAGEMSLALQAKLLRVLMDKQVTRVGSTRAKSVDVRVLFATHRDLEERVRQGAFREDLFYRINVVPVTMPSLRERPEDIPALVEHFMSAVARDLKMLPRVISEAALHRLTAYAFPGNVRELRNLIERAYILSSGTRIEPGDLPLGNESEPTPANLTQAIVARLPHEVDLRETLNDIEKALLQRALQDGQGVQAEAGRLLGLSRSDIAYKLKKHELGN